MQQHQLFLLQLQVGSSAATATAVISSTSVRVRMKDHGMYASNNNVTITGVKSEVSPTALNGAITSGQTGTVNVDDSTNFPNTGYIKIDEEVIYYASKSVGSSFSNNKRL